MIEKLQNITFKESITSAARNCYSKKFITPKDTFLWERSDNLIKDLLKAEHNTTFEHYTLNLRIEGYSRHFIWRYLHGLHDFYASDQQSQRYVHLDIEHFYYPEFLTKEDKEKWKHFYAYLINKYEEFCQKLENTLGLNKKKAQEFARYIIPLGQTPHLTHTINFITAIRYIAFFETISNFEKFEIKKEAKKFANELYIVLLNEKNNISAVNILEVIRKERKTLMDLSNEIQKKVLTLEEKEEIKKIIEKHEKKLNDIDNINKNYENLLIELIEIYKAKYLNLLKNTKEPLNIDKTLALLNQKQVNILKYVNLAEGIAENIENDFDVFVKTNKRFEYFSSLAYASHSMDSQNQRHRTTNKYRPLLKDFYKKLPEIYYTPKVFTKEITNEEIEKEYHQTMKYIYEFFEEQSKKYSFEEVLYLLPNAHNVIIFDIENLEFYTHKAKKRLCWNSQEEIYHYTLHQVKQLQQYIDIDKYNLLPPCQIRKKYNVKPYCPEGPRYCGHKVWNKTLKELENRIY